jgi:O-antigen/teichoic acid export membrane protein
LKDIKNSYYSVIEALTIPVLMLLAAPIFIDRLGIESYGIWMLVNSIVASLSIVNIGGIDTIIKYVSFYRGKNNKTGIGEVFSSIFVLQVLLLILLTLVFFIALRYIGSFEILNLQKQQLSIFINVSQFGLLLFSLKVVEQTILAYFKGYERYDVASRFSIISKVVMIGIQIATVIYTGSLIEVFKNSVIVILLFVAIEIFFIKKYHQVQFISLFSIKRIKQVLSFTGWTWALSIVGVISLQFDRWLIASLGNMATLGLYSLAMLVLTNIHTIFVSSVAWIFPKISNKKGDELIINYYLNLQYLLIFASIFISYIFIKSEFIFNIWLGKEILENSIEYIQNMLILIPIYVIGIIPYYIIQGKGMVKNNAYIHFVNMLVRVVFMSVLYSYYGINGIIISLGISGFLLFLGYMRVIKKYELMEELSSNLKYFLILPFLYSLFMLTDKMMYEIVLISIFFCIFYYIFLKK